MSVAQNKKEQKIAEGSVRCQPAGSCHVSSDLCTEGEHSTKQRNSALPKEQHEQQP